MLLAPLRKRPENLSMKKLLCVFSFFLSLFISKISYSQFCAGPESPTEFNSIENLIYKKDLGFDLYAPKNLSEKPLPVAMIIHGGAWVKGDRKEYRPLAQKLTSMGFAAVTVSYSLVTAEGGRFPVPVEDLRCALKTLKKNRNLFNLNTDRIVAIGFSAGAHLAAEIGLTANNQKFSDIECSVQDFEPDVHGVVAYYGPYDLTNLDGLDALQTSLVVNFLGIHPFLAPSLAMWASPKAQVKKQKIPFYLVHAQNDDLVPVRSSREFSQTLAQKNVPFRYVETSEGAHTLKLFDDRPFAQEATCGALEYLNNFLTQ